MNEITKRTIESYKKYLIEEEKSNYKCVELTEYKFIALLILILKNKTFFKKTIDKLKIAEYNTP